MADNGVAIDVHYAGFEIPSDTLTIEPGETLVFAPVDGHNPEDLELAVFPEDGNVERISNDQASMIAFKPTTSPVSTADLTGDDLTWKVDLQPGTYFIRIKGTWSNPVVPEKPRWGEFAFKVHVP